MIATSQPTTAASTAPADDTEATTGTTAIAASVNALTGITGGTSSRSVTAATRRNRQSAVMFSRIDVAESRTSPAASEWTIAPTIRVVARRTSSATVNARLSPSRRPTSGKELIGLATLQKMSDGAISWAKNPACAHSYPKTVWNSTTPLMAMIPYVGIENTNSEMATFRARFRSRAGSARRNDASPKKTWLTAAATSAAGRRSIR
jgi:hypothetical protein